MMEPHLIFRIHSDRRLGLGHVSRAFALAQSWMSLKGIATIAISGDERAAQIANGKNPFSDDPLPCNVVYLGESISAPLPEDIKSAGIAVFVDLWDSTPELIDDLRPLKVALMEDDNDAHEYADMLFQPYLEGLKWGTKPLRIEKGRKMHPYEEQRGGCRVLKGSGYIVLSPQAAQMRQRRNSEQPLNVKKLLVTFGGTDGTGLASRAYEILANLINEDKWGGSCTLLAPAGLDGVDNNANPRITVTPGIQSLSRHLPEYDAVWCSGGVTLAECLYLGIPVAAWAQNERHQSVITDMALESVCINLGNGHEADPAVVQRALEDWLGPLGQETRQEQSANSMILVDGSGASRIIHELWILCNC